MKFFNDLLSRAPFTILGMMGLFSIVGNFMTLEENIYQTLEAWRSVTRPIWDFLLGWLFEWIGWEMPWWAKDYLTMGVITVSAKFRVDIYGDNRETEGYWDRAKFAFIVAFFWPYVILLMTLFSVFSKSVAKVHAGLSGVRTTDEFLRTTMDRSAYLAALFFETFIYALILIAINYVFVLGGAPSVEPVVEVCFYLCRRI